MKMFCNQCGIHFPHEFRKTVKPPCNFWGDKGMGNLPTEYKKKMWDWVFSMPADEIAVKFKLSVVFSIGAQPIEDANQWEKIKPGYGKMTEKEQQEFQRQHFKTAMQKAREKSMEPKKDPVVPQVKVINPTHKKKLKEPVIN